MYRSGNPLKKRKRNKKHSSSVSKAQMYNKGDVNNNFPIALDINKENALKKTVQSRDNGSSGLSIGQKPRLSPGLRKLKFMSRVKKVTKVSPKVDTPRKPAGKLVCRPLKRSIINLKTETGLGRKSFGSYNSSLEKINNSTKEVLRIEKYATSIEEMADFMIKMKKQRIA